MDGQPQAAVRERDTQDEAGPSRLPGESSINDKTLSIVAKRLGPEWVQLALELCITSIQIQTIETNYPQNTIRQGLDMLWTWKRAQPTSIEQQKTTLRAALRNIGRADFFCESCINDKILSDVASRLGDGWVTLALELGCTFTQVKTIETDYPHNITRQGLEMLETWKHDQSISVEQQITTLGAALENIGRTDIKRFLKDFPTLSIKTNAPWKETKTARATGNWDGPRHHVAAIIESCDGVLEQVHQGSVTFVVRIMSREGLDKLWRMYTSGELAKKLTELLITEELTTEDKSNRDIQATIPKNDYDQACGFFDELKNQRKEFPTVSVETDASLKGTETAWATGNLRMDIAVSNDWEGQDYRRHQVSAVLESCDGVLEQGNPGSGTFVVRIMSREGLDKLWRMYTTGELAKKLSEILIMDELTREDKSDLAIQATIPENDYDQACGFFDELEKDQRKDEEDSSGMMDVEHKELGESSPAKTGYSSDPAEQSAERSVEKLEILHTTTEGALYCEAITSDTMDKKPAGSTRASNSEEEEDPIEALTGNLSKFLPPSGATHLNRTARGRFRVTKAERLFADSKKSGTEDGLLFDAANFAEDELDEMLEKFFETSAPSKVKRSEGIGWIRVVSASYKEEGLGNMEDLETDWKKLQKSRQNIDFNAIKQLAIPHKCLGGIWLLFLDTGEEIDNAWEKIARATVRDKLGTHAKVTPREDTKQGKALYGGEDHVVSVYTKDFTDKDDVMKVEAKLRKLGFRERITFKPRVYSSLGIYSHNQWGLRPGIYTSNWDPRKLAGNIRDCTKSRVTYMINDKSSA